MTSRDRETTLPVAADLATALGRVLPLDASLRDRPRTGQLTTRLLGALIATGGEELVGRIDYSATRVRAFMQDPPMVVTLNSAEEAVQSLHDGDTVMVDDATGLSPDIPRQRKASRDHDQQCAENTQRQTESQQPSDDFQFTPGAEVHTDDPDLRPSRVPPVIDHWADLADCDGFAVLALAHPNRTTLLARQANFEKDLGPRIERAGVGDADSFPLNSVSFRIPITEERHEVRERRKRIQ